MVTIAQMMEARERRVYIQSRLLHTAPEATLISFTLNIAGPVKLLPGVWQAFDTGVDKIHESLEANRFKVIARELLHEETGYEAFLLVLPCITDDAAGSCSRSSCNICEAPYLIKQLMSDIEDSSSLGRLFDIDVLILPVQGRAPSADSVWHASNTCSESSMADSAFAMPLKIGRSDIGLKPRKCLICDKDAAVCARSRSHGLEILLERINQLLGECFCDRIAALAARSLHDEVETTPKPGLVDLRNNGSHSDMCLQTFNDSILALLPHFRQFTKLGLDYGNNHDAIDDDFPCLLNELRNQGIKAEQDMFLATGGVNTHKGIIFSMGLLCGSIGFLWKVAAPSIDTILHACQQMVGNELIKDFETISAETVKTFGERLFLKTGMKGIRGEVTDGFPSVADTGLPVMRSCLLEGFPLHAAGRITLFHLLGRVDDTNIISRSSLSRQQEIKEQLAELAAYNPRPSEELLIKLDDDFISEHISPGGCADLLAICYFLNYVAPMLLP